MSKRNLFIAFTILISLISYGLYTYIKVDKNKLFNSYQNYLKAQNSKSYSQFGKLKQNKEVKLQDLDIDNCQRSNNYIKCNVQTHVENFRGIESQYVEITIDNNKQYKIIKVKEKVNK